MPKLNNGDTAPAFRINDLFSKEIDLQSLKGKKVLLSFYRYASCPLCNLRVNELIGKYPKWSGKGLVMIAVFQSPEESIKKYVGKQDAPFSIIPDPDHELYDKYGVHGDIGKYLVGVALRPGKMIKAFSKGFIPGKMEAEKTMIPADFLIDENGNIHTAYYGQDASDHMPSELINSFVNN